VAAALDEAQERHFQKWQCLGYDSGAPEAPPYPSTYIGEVNKLKRFLRLRIAWMDANLPVKACNVPAVEPVGPFGVELRPNLGRANFVVVADGIANSSGKLPATLFDARGTALHQFFIANGETPLGVEGLASGNYFLVVEAEKGKVLRRLVVVD
jgi:hypothetical protein